MEKEHIIGVMVKVILDNGVEIRGKGLGNYQCQMVNTTKENGKMIVVVVRGNFIGGRIIIILAVG